VKALALLFLMTGSNGQTGNALPRPLVIEVSADAQQNCIFKLEGRSFTEAALRQMLQSDRDKKREIHVTTANHAPWRCVAGAIYIAQSSGFETVGFITEPNSK
jgi:biopolymer transport protein ExbD